MSDRIDNFIIREAGGVRTANSLVIGRGVPLATTAGGLPELESLVVGETQLMPSGGDDTQAILAALARFGRVRLGPGEFLVIGTIALGTGQSVAGCGPERTTIRFLQQAALFSLSGRGTTVEGMAIIGPGVERINSVAVQSTSATDIRLRELSIGEVDRGIDLAAARQVEISHVKLRFIGSNALLVAGPGGQVDITNVVLDEVGNSALVLTSLDGVHCASINISECTRGVLISQGRGHTFQSLQCFNVGLGLSAQGTQGLHVAGALLLECSSTLILTNTSGVHLAGCTLLGDTPLRISGGQAISASGIRSESTFGPHVLVTNGATQVTVSDIHRVNPATPPTYEVDVAGAGGRVVFIQHNFDPARINSGGNFAAL